MLALITRSALAAHSCDIAGEWALRGRTTPSRTGTFGATDLVNVPSVDFNVNFDIRHGSTGGNGTYVGAFGLRMEVISSGVTTYQTGVFSANCTAITWDDATSKSATDGVWCLAWTVGCTSPPPPYGLTLGFLQTLGDNMVLQRAPAKAAVYGITGPQATVPKDASVVVTVTPTAGGSSYTVDAEMNTVHQAPGDPFYVGCTECDTPYSPYATWKAYLNPTAAGGDYTITANCTGCGGDPKYWGASITNVTFGDVWHCSGQSNMWLPLGNTFHRNDTMDAILKEGKYANMRGMIGNSGNGNSIASNPWMTALGAAQAVTNSDNTVSGLMDFGAACWYFGQTITDLGVEAGNLTAEGAPVPLGLVNTAIGGQRIEEYQVNDTVSSPVQCGGASSAWNGRLFARMVMPFVDMTTKGFLWYQVRAGCAAASPRARHALTVASLRSSHQPLSCTYRAKTTWAEQRATALTTSATRAIKRRSSKGGARSSARRQGRRIRSLHSAS